MSSKGHVDFPQLAMVYNVRKIRRIFIFVVKVLAVLTGFLSLHRFRIQTLQLTITWKFWKGLLQHKVNLINFDRQKVFPEKHFSFK